jgi:carbamoyltransferase
MPNPGDSGSSLGAAAALYGKHLDWQTPYLGYDLGGEYPVNKIIKGLADNKIVAVASGRAEFGPRALGNRSILADPRDPEIKNKVNLIKKRESFRPFAPVVMEEHASKWFDINFSSPYMQYAVKCLKPDIIPSVVHADGTSRVQTINKNQHPGLYEVLKQWFDLTGVPVLLNTSLNVKGQPLINDEKDILEWENYYQHQIIS